MKDAIDFSTFVLSLGTSGQMQLGLIPEAQEIKPNLEEAKHTIDILVMLREKTKGNLTKEEEDLVSHLLYELQMHYVSVTRR